MENFEAGYVFTEWKDFIIVTKEPLPQDASLRVDFEFNKSSKDSMKWLQNQSSKISSSTKVISKVNITSDDSMNINNIPNKSSIYSLSPLDVHLKSTYIDLNPELLTIVSNTYIVIKVIVVYTNNTGKKNEKNTIPTEEILVEITYPILHLLQTDGGIVSINRNSSSNMNNSKLSDNWNPLICNVKNDNILSDSIIISAQFSLDNCLAEYVLGASYISIPKTVITSPPPGWTLHLPVEKDKGKNNKLTPLDLKNKFLENIMKLITTQEKIASYTMTVKSKDENQNSILNTIFPVLSSTKGIISYDIFTIETITPEEFNKDSTVYWTITYEPSSYGFLHRSSVKQIKKLLQANSNDGSSGSSENSDVYITFDMFKTPMVEAQSTEGTTQLSMSATVNLISLISPDTSILDLNMIFSEVLDGNGSNNHGNSFEERSPKNNNSKSAHQSPTAHNTAVTTATLIPTVPTSGYTTICLSKPLIKKVDITTTNSIVSSNILHSIPVVLSPRSKAKGKVKSINAMYELQQEISKAITSIATEYVTLYPNTSSDNGNTSTTTTLDNNINHQKKIERKSEFTQLLVARGTMQTIKECLKPKLQQVIWEQYGPRGHALGKDISVITPNSNTIPTNFSSTIDPTGDVELDHVLNDLYVLLTKQCNLVLNQMYKDTIIDKNSKLFDENQNHNHNSNDLTSTAMVIDDMTESVNQKLQRLYNQTIDTEANNQYSLCEQIHLERIQIILSYTEKQPTSSQSTSLFVTLLKAFADYGEFCLRQSSKLLYFTITTTSNDNSNDNVSLSKQYWDKGREALRRAVEMNSKNISTSNTTTTTNDDISNSNSINTNSGSNIGGLTINSIMMYLCCLIEASYVSEYTNSGSIKLIEDMFYSKLIYPQLGISGDKDTDTTPATSNGDDGYDTDELTPVNPMIYTLLAVFHSLDKKPIKARKALVLANKSYTQGSSYGPDISLHGTPRRTLVYLLSQTSIFLSKHAFPTILKESLSMAIASELAVTQKIESRGLPAVTVPFIRHQLYYAKTMANLVTYYTVPDPDSLDSGDNDTITSTILDLSEQCLYSAVSMEDKISGYMLLAKCQMIFGMSTETIINTYLSVFALISSNNRDNSSDNGSALIINQPLYGKIPLSDYITLSKLLIQSMRFDETIVILSNAIPWYSYSATLYLLMGISYIRLDQLVDADKALQYANILDNRNAEIWAYYSLLCLHMGDNRYEEANKSLYQSLRLELKNTLLLRELAVAYLAIDKFSIAEDLIRKTMSIEISQSLNQKPHPVTRKLYADILAGQNQALAAIEEYQRVITSDSNSDDDNNNDSYSNDNNNNNNTTREENKIKLQAADKCMKLLESLGRFEDMNSLREIISVIGEGTNAVVVAQ